MKKKPEKLNHLHGCTANTDQVYLTFIGCEVSGIFHGRVSENSNTWLIFKCGWALVISNNGSHWVERPDSVKGELINKKKELEDSNVAIRNILELAGVKEL